MRARTLVALALLLPALAVAAPPPGSLPRIGYLSGAGETRREEAFRQGLRELGYVDGKNVVIEYRFADGRYDRLPRFAAELVQHDAAVIVAATTPAIHAALRATQTISIVMTLGEAPEGAIASRARPGGNLTGFATINTELIAKRLGLLKEALPRLTRVAVLHNPTNPISAGQVRHAQAAAPGLGLDVQLIEVRDVRDFPPAFASASRMKAEAVLAMPDQLVGDSRQNHVVELALKHRLPMMSWTTGHVRSGALMAYGPDEPDMHRRAASYVDKILKGARAADLPIEEPSKFLLTLNLKTAKTLGLAIPESLRLRAAEVIE